MGGNRYSKRRRGDGFRGGDTRPRLLLSQRRTRRDGRDHRRTCCSACNSGGSCSNCGDVAYRGVERSDSGWGGGDIFGGFDWDFYSTSSWWLWEAMPVWAVWKRHRFRMPGDERGGRVCDLEEPCAHAIARGQLTTATRIVCAGAATTHTLPYHVMSDKLSPKIEYSTTATAS